LKEFFKQNNNKVYTRKKTLLVVKIYEYGELLVDKGRAVKQERELIAEFPL
jgi:hypothetical protein